MSFSPKLSTPLSNTTQRDSQHISKVSGMCAVCTDKCMNICDIGYSAVRGQEAVYPAGADRNQFASEKNYPLDFSCFNINGRVFGAWGAIEDCDKTTVMTPDLSCEIGEDDSIKCSLPFILPAIAKLNWKDYFAGAALAGIPAVVGEAVIMKDPLLTYDEKGQVLKSPLMDEMVKEFKRHYHGKGDIIVQANIDDQLLGVPEYVIKNCGVTSIELKFGQAAKGIMGVIPVKSLERALQMKKEGYVIVPDPEDPSVLEAVKNEEGSWFEKCLRLPMWSDEELIKKVESLKKLGVKHIFFKMGGYDAEDIEHILRLASIAGADMITFDGAGGGTGNAPLKMMNEWGYPAPCLEAIIVNKAGKLEKEGFKIPKTAIAGGIAMEDQVYKALAIGAPYVKFAGFGRAAMTAAMTGQRIGRQFKEGNLPKQFQNCKSIDELFPEVRKLRAIYGQKADAFSPGAIGVYSYLQRVAFGLKEFMALTRKFELSYINKEDLIPLTYEAKMLLKGNWF